jgi:hypothetical protein
MLVNALILLVLVHDPEKWDPVLGKDHAQNKKLNHDPIN